MITCLGNFVSHGLGRRCLVFAVVAALAPLIPVTALAQQVTPTDVVTAQLRRQGVPCTSPQPAVREQKESAPNATVWIVRCNEAAYRVTLVPDLAAKVERIDDSKQNR